MVITDYYNPSKGLAVISQDGLQKYTEALDSYSQIFATIYTSSNNNRFAIDSAWESGYIYYADYDSGYVKKIEFDGTAIASLALTNPVGLSVMQYAAQMSASVSNPPQSDNGCWIMDAGEGEIVKTDNELNVLVEVTGITDPVGIVSNIDGGCYVMDDGSSALIKLSPAGATLTTLDYADFDPAMVQFRDMALDANGILWITGDDRLYSFVYSNELIQQRFVINPLGSDILFSSSSSENNEEMHIGGIDVDRNSTNQLVYVSGGNSEKAWIAKYNSSGVNKGEETYYDLSYPYVIKVVQGLNSECLYILEDPEKWDEFGYGSSSSSSSISSESSSSSNSSSSSSISSSSSFSSLSSSSSINSSSSSSLDSSSSSSSLDSSSSSSSISSSSSSSVSSSSSSSLSSLSSSSSSSSSSYDERANFEVTTTGADTFGIEYNNAVNLRFNWGDGDIDIVSGSGQAQHTYTGAGVWTVTMSGKTDQFNIATGNPLLTKILSPIEGVTGIISLINAFNSCTSLTTLPSGLFDSLVGVTTIRQSFRYCTGLTTLPSGLFDFNTAVTLFQNCFEGCTNLTAIPSGLFDNNTLVTNYSLTFSGCTSLTGAAPQLWTLEPLPEGFQCFNGATGLSNYGDIPGYWGGGA